MGGEFYVGSTADGSDMRPTKGVYLNPNNDNEWSSEPYNKEQREYEKHYRDWEFIYKYCANHDRTLADEFELVLQKKSKLSSFYRKMLIEQAEAEGLIFR